MILDIVTDQKQLKKISTNIEKGTDLKDLVLNMFRTVIEKGGVGLAAPQIGKNIRLFIVFYDYSIVFINPKIIKRNGFTVSEEESCLSCGDVSVLIPRKENIVISYYNEQWKKVKKEYRGMEARIIQHEYDHLDGKLITDFLR